MDGCVLVLCIFLRTLSVYPRRKRELTEDLEAQVKERDVLVEELVLSNQAQMERNETLTVQNEDLRGEFNEAVRTLVPGTKHETNVVHNIS